MARDVARPLIWRGRIGKRWLVIAMAFLGTAVNYLDRASLGVAESAIHARLGLTQGQMGLVLSAFFLTYAFAQLPAGWLVDRFGARATYSAACGWWSVFTTLTGLSRGFWSLFTNRLLLGIGEAGAYPSNAKVVAEWFPPQERALASAIFDSGSRVGTALAMPLVSSVLYAWGWRYSFAAGGLLGLAWAIAWYAFYRKPEAPISPIYQRARQRICWSSLFGYRKVWAMAGGFFCLSFVNYFYITWFPTYLREGQGLSLLQVGTLGMIPPLLATAGGLCGGWISDRLVRNGCGLNVARKVPIVGGLLGSSVIFLATLTTNPFLAVAWLSLSYACIAFAAAGVWALPGDVAPTIDYVGSLGGIQNCASNLAGVVLAPLVGFLLDRTGGFFLPLAIASAISLIGALIYLLALGPVARLEASGVD